MTDKELTKALIFNEQLGLHLYFEAYVRIREAERHDIDPYPFPIPNRN
jgi:hypothetical protein